MDEDLILYLFGYLLETLSQMVPLHIAGHICQSTTMYLYYYTHHLRRNLQLVAMAEANSTNCCMSNSDHYLCL